jgi:hypothetical protein
MALVRSCVAKQNSESVVINRALFQRASTAGPILLAAPADKSMIQPFTNGPRWTMVTDPDFAGH